MAIDKARRHLQKWGREGDIIELDVSSATVELAAAAIGCAPSRIAKTISLRDNGGALAVVASGDAKVSNQKFRQEFSFKPRMLTYEETERLVGHAVGGVCPFGVNEGVPVYLDVSLKRFDIVYPACGSSNSVIKLTLGELKEYSLFLRWVDVCGGWQ